MVEVDIAIAADTAVRTELVTWLGRMPRMDELNLTDTESDLTATVNSPPQLATLVMAIAMFLKAKPEPQRPAVTMTADNGESLAVTTAPDPHEIRSVYIAMDKVAPTPVEPSMAALTAGSGHTETAAVDDVIDAELVEPEPDTKG